MKIKLFFFAIIISFYSCNFSDKQPANKIISLVQETDSIRILNEADKYLTLEPIPLTNFYCERSLGTRNDFYSEGDYWWPNPESPDSPYVKRDGLSNPDNFKEHRIAMRNMSVQVASLVAAFKLTKNEKYAKHALNHYKSWFINDNTKMNPNLNYSQAIKGICPGRGVGVIDGIHLVEPARALSVLKKFGGIDEQNYKKIENWFNEFLVWITTHEYGIDERERKNNHGSTWVMQVAEYARLTNNSALIDYSIKRFKEVLLPNQMGSDGSFPMELARTKPYGYSLFNIDILSTVCHILSNREVNLWEFQLDDGRGMKLAVEYIYPYIKDKSLWPLDPDVMYWDEWPVRHPTLLFAGISFNKENYLNLWKSLPPLPKTEEGIRNFPIRQPLLWID